MKMEEIRVLIVDDSSTARPFLSQVIEQAPGFRLLGMARDGHEAVELCRSLRPDVVIMDLKMPEMDGLQATEQIMANFPTPILVVSSVTNREERVATAEALAAGAVDVLDKKADSETDELWQNRFLRSLKLVSKVRVITHPRGRLRKLSSAREASQRGSRPIRLIALGGSTGGPGAVAEILKALPAGLAVPILLVLHTSESFGSPLASWLDSQSPHQVRYAQNGESLAKVTGVVMAPPGRHLILRQQRLFLTLDPERYSCRPSVDVLFESLAQEVGPGTCACLLTGMGKDGARGLLALRQQGAITIAQDEASSIVYGMPREAILLEAATHVASLDQIAQLINNAVSRGKSSDDP